MKYIFLACLKMEVIFSFETSEYLYTTWRYSPEAANISSERCENLESACL
jgi:hypothetical protein